MADQPTLRAIETAELIVQTDNSRAGSDPFKLPTVLRSAVDGRLTTAKSTNAAASMTAGDTVGASVQVKEAHDKLREALRNGFNHIHSLTSEQITPAQRAAAFTHYGFTSGKLGSLTTATRVNHLSDLAIAGASSVLAVARYPASILNKITNWLAVLEGNEAIAGGGTRQAAIEARNTAREALKAANSRTRFFYSSASDAQDKTPELARIGFQPRRDPGEAESQPFPGTPGAVTFNATTRELTIAALPEHATSIRAFRKPAGGDAEPAGISTTTTVSVTAFAPLTPGVSYEVWLTGHNSRGDGAVSNKVTFTA